MQIANLTFARFVAAFLVFLHHSPQLQTYSSGILGNRSSTFMANGFVGVTFFFILSGFVLSHMYFASFHDIRFSNTVSFYAHRLARIVPLWLFLSLPLIALSIYQGTYDRSLFLYLGFVQAWSSNIYVAFAYITVAWTLSVEMLFYLLFPFISWFLHRLCVRQPFRLWPAVCLAGLAIPFGGAMYFALTGDLPIDSANSSHRWLYRNPMLRLGDFILGIGLYLAFLHSRVALKLSVQKVLGIVLLAVGLTISTFLMSTFPPSIWTFDFAYVMPFGAIVLGASLVEVCDRPIAIRSRFLILLGHASFAFYLIHGSYALSLANALRPVVDLNEFVFSIFAVSVITLASMALLVVIERPAQRYLRQHVATDIPSSSQARSERLSTLAGIAPGQQAPADAAKTFHATIATATAETDDDPHLKRRAALVGGPDILCQ